jgi:CBS domain-containing protein
MYLLIGAVAAILSHDHPSNGSHTKYIFEQRQVRRVPILRGAAVVGIVSRANVLRALGYSAHKSCSSSAEDGAIRERLLAELKDRTWVPTETINVLVRNGVVTLSGVIADERQRQALLVAGENIPGVKKVVDQLIWIAPSPVM